MGSRAKAAARAAFRVAVLERDNHRCRVCGAVEGPGVALDPHHITARDQMPGGGYVVENGVTLCDRADGTGCHVNAEAPWDADKALPTPPGGWWPVNLYALVGSSYDKALAASVKELRRKGQP